MTNWIEVTLRVDGEAAEAVAQELQKWCHQGIVIEQTDFEQDTYDEGEVPPAEQLIVRGYFPDDAEAEEKRLQIERSLGYMNMMYPMPKAEYRTVNDEDWANAWKDHYKPVRLGEHILIRPPWIDVQPQPDDIEIILDPGMAFGTGTHPTTQLCLEAIEQVVSPAYDVLDLGCGSGILSIAAAKFGAKNVVAVDIDTLAVQATQDNAAVNHVADAIHVYRGGLATVQTSARRFDLLLVNILAHIIIEMCEQGLGQLVRPGGRAIFSGIIDEQADDVEAALRATGLHPIRREQQGDWIMIEAARDTDG